MDPPASKDRHMMTQKFVSLLESVGSRALSFVEEEEYVEAYKKIFKSGAFTLQEGLQPQLAGSSAEARKMRSNFCDFVKKIVKEEIEIVVREERINDSFNKIDNLKAINQCLPNENTWRPPGNVQKHMEPFAVSAKIDSKNELLRLVTAEREKLEIFKVRIEEKRRKFLSTNHKLEKKMTDLCNAVLVHPETSCQKHLQPIG